MMEQISSLKTEVSSNFSTILAILCNLQGNRISRSDDQQMSHAKETEVFHDTGVDFMEVFYHTLHYVV